MSIDYSFFFHIDPFVDGLPLVNSPHLVFLILFFYVYLVMKWGPNFMRNRPAYDLKMVILFYNLSQIYFNFYLTSAGIIQLIKKDYFDLRVEEYESMLSYYYFLLKIYDLTETFIFILRKKQRQVSFLHVYHHVMVILCVYYGMRSLPGGHNIVFGIVNTSVHALIFNLLSSASTTLGHCIMDTVVSHSCTVF
ncbi:Elongation of very long chain fatty acids protein 1 [Pseudolycoriella hygida]|uniref:Elongation of very long chain fatty acids protein n=1 Tax=Pseudolycoriella hygida TaxID=35572 RepID=A0A9Q0S2H7_9DIPT|nr:Elongation of very long chain fatty acids protein 1 [Pseudolycoriella hygida]